MNRRNFLRLLAGAGAASATSYFFAPVGGWHSDVIVNPNETHLPPHLWGLRYYQTKPPYVSDEYHGISRHPVTKEWLKRAAERMYA